MITFYFEILENVVLSLRNDVLLELLLVCQLVYSLELLLEYQLVLSNINTHWVS
jgi:hypothetical protein